MSLSLTIPVSEELMQRLQQQATLEGKTIEAVAADNLNLRSLHPRRSTFLEKWAGSLNSDLPELSQRHDEYLGQSHLSGSNDQ